MVKVKVAEASDVVLDYMVAMRCYAISELGPEVEVPDELLEE